MFSIAFMVVVSFWGNPETQTVSHSFPKVCAPLQKKWWSRCSPRRNYARWPEVRARLLRVPVERHILHALFANSLHEGEVERVFAAREIVDARGFGADFRERATGFGDRYGVAFDCAFAPRIALSVVIEVDLEGTVPLHGPHGSE